MAVLFETSVGELVIDLFVEECPLACNNLLKLCKTKFYNGCLFYNIQQNYIVQTGDPSGTGKGGNSIFGLMAKEDKRYFHDEINKLRKIDKVGLVLMAHDSDIENTNRSQFFITLRGSDYFEFEGKYTIIGEVAEGLEVLEKLNNIYCDEDGRPYQDIRIKHTAILDDPYDDMPGLENLIPPSSPLHEKPLQEVVKSRIRYEDDLDDNLQGKSVQDIENSIKRKEAQSRAVVLEMTGDLPDADAKPPVEVLFVCKLNSITRDEDLELIFSRFGKIKSCEIIRDFKTGDSLNYAFIEFETESACIEAYDKMNNVLIDDRRIKVDFSQSVSHLWNRFLLQPRRPKNKTEQQISNNITKSSKVNYQKNENDAKSNLSVDKSYRKRSRSKESRKISATRDSSRDRTRRNRSRERSNSRTRRNRY